MGFTFPTWTSLESTKTNSKSVLGLSIFYEVLKTKLNKWKSNNHSVYLDENCQLRSESADKKIFVQLDKPQINEFVFKNLPFFV